MGAILPFCKRHASQPITSRRQACGPPEARTSVARAQETHRSLPEPGAAKLRGITYTPEGLASFVAEEIVAAAQTTAPRAKRRVQPSPRADGLGDRPSDGATAPRYQPLRVLDPAVGHGQLLLSLLAVLAPTTRRRIKVHGYDTDCNALDLAEREIRARFPDCNVRLDAADFLTAASRTGGVGDTDRLFSPPTEPVRHYDMIIANPPYVRTQTMGCEQSRRLARNWGFSGRIDLYHAFLIGIARLLAPGGIAGVIVSNRFMTTKGRRGHSSVPGGQLQRSWHLGSRRHEDVSGCRPASSVAVGTQAKSNWSLGPLRFHLRDNCQRRTHGTRTHSH